MGEIAPQIASGKCCRGWEFGYTFAISFLETTLADNLGYIGPLDTLFIYYHFSSLLRACLDTLFLEIHSKEGIIVAVLKRRRLKRWAGNVDEAITSWNSI